jgi:heptosyltransferase-3
MTRIDLPPRPRILVVVLRRLGDVLLTTPLIRSLRRGYPDATIEALVFADTAGILAGNPDLDGIVIMPPRPSVLQSLALGVRLFKKYYLAVSVQSGDRPTGFALVAGRNAVAPVEARFSGRLKRALLARSIPFTGGLHRVEELLRLADLLGVPREPELVAPHARAIAEMPDGDYAVIHAAPMFRYKQWTADGWRGGARKF